MARSLPADRSSADDWPHANVDADADTSIALDPFEYWPHLASCIKGLGGETIGEDESYAFHSAYRGYPAGPLTFRLDFDELAAATGALVLQVLEIDERPGAYAQRTEMRTIAFAKIIRAGGTAQIGIEARTGKDYALQGMVFGHFEASARSLKASVETGTRPPPVRATTIAAIPMARGSAMLASRDPPSLERPSSQPMTPDQCSGAAFDGLTARYAPGGDPRPLGWREAFILRMLELSGLLAGGGSALSIAGPGRVETAAVAAGLSVSTIGWESTTAGVDKLPVNDWRDIGALSGHDMVWCGDVAAMCPQRQDAEQLVDLAVQMLRPGGLGLFVLPYGELRRADDARIFVHADIERLAMVLLSHGHDLCQLRRLGTRMSFDAAPTLYGLVVRRGG